jgi:EmrB/QacA subfamily drug resistance transporter
MSPNSLDKERTMRVGREATIGSGGSTLRSGHPGIILALVCAAAFIGVLDIAIVNVALPSIERDLGLSQQSLQWVVISYSLLFGGFLLLGGRLADLLGRRRIFVAGLILFALASLASGLAPSMAILVVSRGFQGLAAALTAPSALSILTTTFSEGERRNKALGIWGAVAGSGATAGVIAGGVLTSGPGWQWIFFINVPIGLGLAVLALRFIPEGGRETGDRRFDFAGAASITAGLLMLVYAVNQTIDRGWRSAWTTVPLAVAAVLIAAFVFNELRSPAPLVPFEIFRRPTLAAANVMAGLVFGSFVPLIFLSTLYMQQIIGYSALRTGVTFLTMSVSSLAASAVAGRWLVGRLGVRGTLTMGLSLLATGLLLMSRVPVGGTYADLAPPFLLAGIGLGSCVVPVQVAAFTGVAEREAGLASGLVSTAQEVGGAVAVAVIATVAAARTSHIAAEGSRSLSMPAALAEGFRWGFAAAAAVAILGVLLALVLLRSPTTPVTGPGRDEMESLEVGTVHTRRPSEMP